MKKLLVVMLSFSLIFIFSAVGFAQGVGPELGSMEGYADFSTNGTVLNAGARMWMGETDFFRYAAGGEIAFGLDAGRELSYSDYDYYGHQNEGLGVFGVATLDWTNFLAEYFDPAGIFSEHGVEIKNNFALGYRLSIADTRYHDSGVDFNLISETTYPITDDIDLALKTGARGFGFGANMQF